MELLQLTYFCEAARCENFTLTAKKFSVPPSDISQSVSRLEKELGQKLFDRFPNRIVLNDYGKLFLEYISPALGDIGTAVKRVSEYGGGQKSELRLRICVCRSIVTGAIEKFRRTWQDVSFYISHATSSDEQSDIIIADAGFAAGGRSRHLLMEENIVLAVECGNPLAHVPVVTGDMLRSQRFIAMSEGSSMYEITGDICADFGFEPEIVIQSDDPFYIRKYVEMGLGIAFFPESSWKGQIGENVVLKNIGNFRRKIYAYCAGEKYMSKASEAFLAMLKDAFEKERQNKTD